MCKCTFFNHKFVLQGVFSKRKDCKSYIGISIYIFSGAYGLLIFFNRFDTRAHEWKLFRAELKIFKNKTKKSSFKNIFILPSGSRNFGGKQPKLTAANIDVFIKIDIWGAEAKRNSIGWLLMGLSINH